MHSSGLTPENIYPQRLLPTDLHNPVLFDLPTGEVYLQLQNSFLSASSLSYRSTHEHQLASLREELLLQVLFQRSITLLAPHLALARIGQPSLLAVKHHGNIKFHL
jgi:hypothetical protein